MLVTSTEKSEVLGRHGKFLIVLNKDKGILNLVKELKLYDSEKGTMTHVKPSDFEEPFDVMSL